MLLCLFYSLYRLWNLVSSGQVFEICLHSLQVMRSMQPLVVYFPDSSQWLSRAVPKSNRKEFVSKVQEQFNQLSGPVVLICGQNKVEAGSKEKEKFVSFNNSRVTCIFVAVSRLFVNLLLLCATDNGPPEFRPLCKAGSSRKSSGAY